MGPYPKDSEALVGHLARHPRHVFSSRLRDIFGFGTVRKNQVRHEGIAKIKGASPTAVRFVGAGFGIHKRLVLGRTMAAGLGEMGGGSNREGWNHHLRTLDLFARQQSPNNEDD
jgi:hypothetical protein